MREEEMTKGMRRLIDGLCYVLLFFYVILLAWLVLPAPKKDMEADYLNAVIGAVFGTVLSLVVIYAGYRIEQKRDRKAAKEALMDGLRFNDDRAVQMLGQFAQNITPTYQFDTTGLVVWLSKSAGLFGETLLKKINWHRYQMDHANTILSTYYILKPSIGDRDERGRHTVSEYYREAVERLTTIHNGTHRLLMEIEREATIPDVS